MKIIEATDGVAFCRSLFDAPHNPPASNTEDFEKEYSTIRKEFSDEIREVLGFDPDTTERDFKLSPIGISTSRKLGVLNEDPATFTPRLGSFIGEFVSKHPHYMVTMDACDGEGSVLACIRNGRVDYYGDGSCIERLFPPAYAS